MARQASPNGPHLLALIEDARVNLARAALAEKKGVTTLTTIVDQKRDNTRSQEFHRQPDERCRSIWAYLHERETFEDVASFHLARRFRDHGRPYDACESGSETGHGTGAGITFCNDRRPHASHGMLTPDGAHGLRTRT